MLSGDPVHLEHHRGWRAVVAAALFGVIATVRQRTPSSDPQSADVGNGPVPVGAVT
jgi:hypothetical protein